MKIIVYKLNVQLVKFELLTIDENVPLEHLLDPSLSLLFIDNNKKRVWIWHGKNVSIKARYFTAKLAPLIRDIHNKEAKIAPANEPYANFESEPLDFKIMIGKIKERKMQEIEYDPSEERDYPGIK